MHLQEPHFTTILRSSMARLGIQCTDAEIKQMMEAVDENRDGKISRDEFQKLFE